MTKPPVPRNEKERLKALRDYEILDTKGDDKFDRITELASLICDVPISLVSLIDENRQWFKSSVGLGVKETSRELAFCGYTILDNFIFEIEDATKDERFKNNALVTQEPNIRFYAGFPLIDPQGYSLGSLCVIDRKPKTLDVKQKRILQLLAEEVTALIVERRLREQLRNFEILFDISKDLLFIGGTDGYFKKINPAFTKLFGWTKEELLTTSSFEFYHPEDIESTAKELQKLREGKGVVNFLQRFKTSKGDYKTIQWTSTPETDTGDIFGIGRDVSELKLKEQQLAESEEKLKVFFENSLGLMCTHDLEGKLLSVNTAGAAIFGYSKNDLLSMTLFDLIEKPYHIRITKYLQGLQKSGNARGQMTSLHKDDSRRIWIYNSSIENNNGRPYIIVNGMDITERHHLEQDLKRASQMLEQTNQVARVGGWELDVGEQKVLWTSVTKEIHGVGIDYEPDLTTGINFYKEGEDRDRITEAITLAINEGISWDVELRIISVKNEEVWVRAIGNAELENGVCKRLYGTFQDINDYKITELALKSSIDTQEKLNTVLFDHIELIEKQDRTIEKIQEFKFLADSIPQIVWTSNPDGSPSYYNKEWINLTGLTLEDTLETGWGTILHPEDLENVTEIWSRALTTGKPMKRN